MPPREIRRAPFIHQGQLPHGVGLDPIYGALVSDDLVVVPGARINEERARVSRTNSPPPLVVPAMNALSGPVDCTNNFNSFLDDQKEHTCHVCLSTGAVVGLSVSLLACVLGGTVC